MNLFQVLTIILSLLAFIFLLLFIFTKRILKGKIIYLESTQKKLITDIENLKKIGNNQEKILDILIDNIPHGIIVLDNQSRILKINDSILNLFYLEKEKLIGSKTIFIFNNKKLEDLVSSSMLQLKIHRDEIIFYGDEDISLEVQAIPLPVEEYNTLLLFRNTTQEAEFSKLRSQFVANVSHEMRTPLTSIRGYIETALDSKLDNETMQRYLKKVLKEIDRLSFLIEDVLDLSNIEYKRNVVLKQSYNIVRIIKDIIESLNYLAEKNNVSINFNFNKENIELKTDEELFTQLVRNMIENSIFHAGQNINLDIDLEETGSDILLSFTDNGTGISKTDLPYIFQRFYRGKNPDSSQKISSGLGLSIVKHTVDLHKGKIDVSSNPGDKTVFRISFPKTEL